jgi:hypothetical protein
MHDREAAATRLKWLHCALPDGHVGARTRSVGLTPADETRRKAAAIHWKDAQKHFETAYGSAETTRLRSTLAEVVAAL